MSYSKKEVQTFAAQCDKQEKDAGTELSRQGSLAAKVSLRKGWDEDDLKGKGEGRAFFVECLEARRVKVTPQNVERYTLSAHPQVAERFDDLVSASYAIRDKNPGARINNVQEAMLREARTGVSTSKVKAKAMEMAKADAASHTKRSGGGTQKFKTRKDLVDNINASIKRKLEVYYGKDKAASLYTEVCIRANDLPNTKPYKKAAKLKPVK